MAGDISEETYSLIFAALKHPLRRRILRMLERPTRFTEILESLSVSTGHLNYYLETLAELISKNREGKYRLSSLGAAALNLLRDVEEPPSPKRTGTNLLTRYSALACLALLILSGYCLLHEEWLLPPQPSLSRRFVGETPFSLEPNQSVTATYTIIYNWTGTGDVGWAKNGTFLEIKNRRAPANTFEVREYDLASYHTTPVIYDDGRWIYDENATFAVKVYSPSGELLNEDLGVHGRGWPIKEPGTYRIVITNLSPSETWKIEGIFQFTRNRFYKPYAWLGYLALFLGLGFPLVSLIEHARLRRDS